MLAAVMSNSESSSAGSLFELALLGEPPQAASEAAPKSAQGSPNHSAQKLGKKITLI
jgi:hypothetical protein